MLLKGSITILRSGTSGSLPFNKVYYKASFIKHGNNNSQMYNYHY